MADTRINAIATTATASASDDFLPIDGTTNGTRKLSAYSPTFGGNLTVSGTGESSFAGQVDLKRADNTTRNGILTLTGSTYDWGIGSLSGSSDLVIRKEGAGTAMQFTGLTAATITGNLTVSGTGTSTFANILRPLLFSTTAGVVQTASASTTGVNIGFDANLEHGWIQATRNNSTETRHLQIQPLGNNVLIGTTVNSGALLQIGTNTTTSAGGIGFGTDTSLYRSAASSLRNYSNSGYGYFEIQGSSGSYVALIASNGTTQNGLMGCESTGHMYIQTTVSAPMYLRTNNTTALTLDSSQNATFAGSVYVGSSSTYKMSVAASSGANRDIFAAQVSGASNGLTVKWNHATTTTRINISNIPTSSVGLASGDIYSNAGILTIVP